MHLCVQCMSMLVLQVSVTRAALLEANQAERGWQLPVPVHWHNVQALAGPRIPGMPCHDYY